MRYWKTVRRLVLSLIVLLTLLTTPIPADTDTAALLGQKAFVMAEALAMGQGVTTDGTFFYTAGAATGLHVTYLGKIGIETMTMTAKRLNPLPEICSSRGNDHIGGISFYGGRIYAAVEGGDVCRACIVVFDPDTLEPTGDVYDLPNEDFDDGVPWLAVDPDTGFLYASRWSHADAVYVFDVNDNMRPVRTIRPVGIGALDRIQGGEFYHGALYLSQDSRDNGTRKRLLRLDPQTCEVTEAAERDVNGGRIEAEDLTVLVRGGAASLFVLDYNKAVGVFLREYAVKGLE
ncbi:MAG: hypothetical protein IJT44_02790 [Clostridia bacterium]|nr:hypothetical protein [Clostridia bacterium]